MTMLGILGGGQLGRMFAAAARTMGFEVMVLDPDPEAPAAHFATHHLCASFDDAAALARMASSCAAITTEFENVPAATLELLERILPVHPSSQAVAIAQDRIKEKAFFAARGVAVGPYAAVESSQDLIAATARVGFPAIIKTARLGYDGKGQVRVADTREVEALREALTYPVVVEALLPLDLELSVVLGRSHRGAISFWPVAENRHRNGVLDLTIAPARIAPKLEREARAAATELARSLKYVGVMAVEFFVSAGRLLANEMAPRPHNSGHYTLDACHTDQFEQQVRILAHLPLGDTQAHSTAVMTNLMGDLWHPEAPDWSDMLEDPRVKLHLYGKRAARAGRKMGHLTTTGSDLEQALSSARALRQRLGLPAV